MILADSAIWIDHLRSPVAKLATLLLDEEIVAHPFVTGEIALGSIANRHVVIRELDRLRQLSVATPAEVSGLIEDEQLWGRGIGYVDAHLLASVRLMPGTRLWTRDARLRAQAERLGVAA
jgi:predicted nucleic acid-binding protein